MLPARSPFAHLDLFIRDILGSGATLLHEEHQARAVTTTPQALGWSAAVTAGFKFPAVFEHQAQTYQRLKEGQNVIITTPTASGKTGAFFPAIFERLEQDPRVTALFVYPLVALGQDQRDKLQDFKQRGPFDWEIGAFHGSVPVSEVFRENVRMVTATPDKLHWALDKPAVRKFLSKLSFIVLDEAHTYRGGFGCEVAGMLRRLLGLARALGAQPQVVLSTATIGNPAEFADELVGIEATEVSQSGAAKHGKRFYLADHRGQPRRFWDSVMRASQEHQLKVLAFFRGRSRAARLYSTYRSHSILGPLAHLYMSGTSDREGRLSQFRKAKNGVMFATNALEAGVDIGDLEVVIIDGYPGSRMAFRQMAGRAGRVAPGTVLYLPALSEQGVPRPVDAFYSNMGNFKELLTGPVEKAVVEAENPYLTPRHQQRRNFEFYVAGLNRQMITSPPYWNLRGEKSTTFAVMETEEWEQKGLRAFDAPLESPSQHYALTEKHVDAQFSLDGQAYKVVNWVESDRGTAILVEKTKEPQLFTRGLHSTVVRTKQMQPWVKRGPLVYRHGDVLVQRRYLGYAVMRQFFERSCTGCDREPKPFERICAKCGGRIQDRMQDQCLSEHPFEKAVELEPFLTHSLEVGIDPTSLEQPTAVAHTLKHLLQKLIPERVACDENDLGGAFREDHDNYFFLYDDWHGGLGFARRSFECMDDLLRRALELASKECCHNTGGCYECCAVSRCFSPSLSSGERRPTHKQATAEFLQDLLGVKAVQHEKVPIPNQPPSLPQTWPVEARKLLDMYGLSLPEVSARLGIPSRQIQKAVNTTKPLRIAHVKFGEGVFMQGFGSGDKREVLVYFPGVGQKRLLLKYASLEVIEA